MSEEEQHRLIRRKTRQRLGFALVTLVLYFAYVLNYLPSGRFLGARLGDSYVTGSLLMFAGLIVVFILLELVFLALNRDTGAGNRGE
jgi:uncharacterized membrane protein (DUF485 family)